MAVVFQEWLNSNELRSYPLHDLASRESVDGEFLPHNLLADASIWIPRHLGRYVYIGSAAVTPHLVTLTFVASEDSPLDTCPSSSSLASSSSLVAGNVFTPIGSISLTRPVTRFRNYPIIPFVNGVGGWVSLGYGALGDEFYSLVFDNPEATVLAGKAVRVYGEIPVIDIGKVGVTPPLRGLVRLKGSPGSVVTRGGVATINGQPKTVGFIGLDLTNNAVTTLSNFAGDCGHRPESGNCLRTPIRSINDVTPDCNGNINIVFSGAPVIGDAEDGLVLDYPVGLGEACPDKYRVISNTGDVCDTGPQSSLSSLSSMVSSSSMVASSSSLAPPPVGGSYCETFEGIAPAELTVIGGSFGIEERIYVEPEFSFSKRYVTGPGYGYAEALAIDFERALDVTAGFVVSGIIRPVGDGEGHLVFGYAGIDDFFMVGIITSHPDAPLGGFFIGRKTGTESPSGDTLGDDGVGRKYQILPGAIYPALVDADARNSYDYRLKVTVIDVLGSIVVYWEASWIREDGSYGYASNTPGGYVLPLSAQWGPANAIGLCGLGTFNANAEFDEFGINCDGLISSSAYACNSCEYWDAPEELDLYSQRIGTWSIVLDELVSGGSANDLIIKKCPLYIENGMIEISTIVSVVTNAYVVFSYTDDLNFWIAGVDTASEPGFPDGKFVVAQVINGTRVAYSKQAILTTPTSTIYRIRVRCSILTLGGVDYVQVAVKWEWQDVDATRYWNTDHKLQIGSGKAAGHMPTVVLPGMYAEFATSAYDRFCAG